MEQTQNHWYDKTWLVVVLCIFFFPVGLYGLWKSPTISKEWKIGITIVAALLFLISIASKDNSKTEYVTKEEKPIEETIIKTKHIPGITPVDVYLSFEKIGFTTEKQISSNGSFWFNDLEEKGLTCNVRTSCEDGVNEVDHIRLNITRSNPQFNNIKSMKPFLKYGCSIPFDGNDPEKVNNFIDENYYNDKAKFVISGVKFTIFAPTEFVRMIDIEVE